MANDIFFISVFGTIMGIIGTGLGGIIGCFIKNTSNIIPVKNDLSETISQNLKKLGMKYVGAVIIYSYLQAIGIVNDHELICFKH